MILRAVGRNRSRIGKRMEAGEWRQANDLNSVSAWNAPFVCLHSFAIRSDGLVLARSGLPESCRRSNRISQSMTTRSVEAGLASEWRQANDLNSVSAWNASFVCPYSFAIRSDGLVLARSGLPESCRRSNRISQSMTTRSVEAGLAGEWRQANDLNSVSAVES